MADTLAAPPGSAMVDPDVLYSNILEHMQGGVLALDLKGHVLALNPAAESMLGLTAGGAGGQPLVASLFTNQANDGFVQTLLDAVYEATFRHTRDVQYFVGDTAIWLNLTTSALWSPAAAGAARRKIGVVALFVDITARKMAEAALQRANEELEVRVADRTRQLADANATLTREVAERVRAQERLAHLAEHDALTGLPNRRSFEAHLETAVAAQAEFVLLYLDLDGFKAVNDTHGHDMGDWLLQCVSGRLESCTRKGDLLARLGGDEFAIILKSVATTDGIRIVAERIIESLASPYAPRSDLSLHIGASVGAAPYPRSGRTGRELTQAADGAMYDAKRGGRGTWRLAAPAAGAPEDHT